MIEPNERIADQYQALTTFLMENVGYDAEKVDRETIESIIDASCEFDQSDDSKTSTVIPNMAYPEKSISVKFTNIHFGFKQALDMVMLVPTKQLSGELEIIKFIISIMKFTVDSVSEEVGIEETRIIKALCMLDYAGKGISKDRLKAEVEDISDKEFSTAIATLEKLNCIQSFYEDIDGKTEEMYRMTETVLLNIK